MTNKEFIERVYRKVYGHEIPSAGNPREHRNQLYKCWAVLEERIASGQKWNNLMEMIKNDSE